MNLINCKRCGADILIPDLTAEIKSSISDTAHRMGRMQAIIELKNRAGLSLAEAKAVAFHLSDTGSKCHRCNRELVDENEEVDCPMCRSMNLKW